RCGYRGEVARAHCRRHGREELRRGTARFEAFVIRHEEQPVLAVEDLRNLDGAGECETVLVLAVRLFGWRGLVWTFRILEEVRPRVQTVVAEELKEGAVILIGAAARGHVNLTGGTSKLRGVDAGLDLKLLQSFDGRKNDVQVE